MKLKVIAPEETPWPSDYKKQTEKFSSQVGLHHNDVTWLLLQLQPLKVALLAPFGQHRVEVVDARCVNLIQQST